MTKREVSTGGQEVQVYLAREAGFLLTGQSRTEASADAEEIAKEMTVARRHRTVPGAIEKGRETGEEKEIEAKKSEENAATLPHPGVAVCMRRGHKQ
mgnify:CR=1 FL=1